MSSQAGSLLGQSARGASVLIGLQIGSRALTFAVNQVLLRFLSASLLGASARLELFLISILTFSRESIRISLGRQSGKSLSHTAQSVLRRDLQEQHGTPFSKTASDNQHGVAAKPQLTPSSSTHLQESVNIAYIAPVLGLFLSTLIGYIYKEGSSVASRDVPFLDVAIYSYGFSAVLELAAEPCFAAASQEGMLHVRARAETVSAITRCVITCATAFLADRCGKQLGALPYAAGQISYALSLNFVYWPIMLASARERNYRLIPSLIKTHNQKDDQSQSKTEHVAHYFAKPVLLLAGTLYGQSVLKHFLTQGDSLLVSFFASYAAQGEYALASNYGSLLARMLFQPVEESSRGVFGNLLGAATTSSQSSLRPPQEKTQAARDYLKTVLRFYGLLSIGILSLGPKLAPLMLRVIAGNAWANSSAGLVLSLYCYYIPLLAFNGILEAFVAATATPAQLRTQSVWMTGFSMAFASVGYLCLHVYELGVRGLIIANSVNMAIRVLWSWYFVADYLGQQGLSISYLDVLPRFEAIGCSVPAIAAFYWVETAMPAGIFDVALQFGIAVVFGSSLLILERDYLRECYHLLRPTEAQMMSKKKQ